MSAARTTQAQRARTTAKVVRGPLRALVGLAAMGACLLAFAPFASADLQVCAPGSAAGQCTSPRGVAVDFETGNVFVADNGNDRIDVFKENGKAPASPSNFAANNPVWIALDNNAASPSHHDLYLSTEEFTVKKLKPNGEALATFGEKGDGTPEGCQLERANDPIAVGPGGVVYLGDSYDKDGPGGSDVRVSRVVKFDAAGGCIGAVTLFEGELQGINDLAVDSTGAIYVTVAGDSAPIRKYDASGALLKQFEKVETSGLAVDTSDHLFAEQRSTRLTKSELDHFFTEFDSSGAILRHFDYASGSLPGSPGLAALHSADGDLFASSQGRFGLGVQYHSLPPAGPVLFPEACHPKAGGLGSDKATLQAEVNPEGKATGFKYEYLTQAQFEAEGNEFKNAKSSAEEPLGGEADFELHEAAQKVTGLQPETTYRCRVVAKNADSGPEGTIGEEGTFTTGPPFEFGAAWASEVGTEEATLNLEGNPEGIPATAQVEYVSDASYQESGFAEAQSSPEPELDYGAGEALVLRTTTLTGLAPGTLYHYRLRARNLNFPEGIVCLEGKQDCPAFEHAFRTFNPAEGSLPDERAWEMVSPPNKNGGDVGGTPNTKGAIEERTIEIQASSGSGEAITYTSWTSFGDSQAAPATSQYLSKRTPGGWQTENISPFGFQHDVAAPPYLGFSPDLRFGAVQASETSLAPGCPAGFEAFYLHEADTGALRCLTPEAPNTARKINYCFIYAGASEDGSRVLFKAKVPYANAPAGEGFSLYEWHEGQIQVVSVLPGQSEPVVPSVETTFGARSTGSEGCENGLSIRRHAVSADGSKAIWTYVPTDKTKPSQLLDRVNGSETVQLDAVQSGVASKPGNGLYWAASKDGQVVYFTDENRLISQVKAEAGAPDLYRYDFSKPIGQRLTDLTSGTGKGTVPGDVQGVVGASDDGSIVYFAAKAALTPEAEENEAGQHAEAGKKNLYLYDAGEEKTRFVATLSDPRNWETQPKNFTARVTPDGDRLAFVSAESQALAGYDNTLAATSGPFAKGNSCAFDLKNQNVLPTGDPLCQQVFIYDAQGGKLTCASCNPSGARPVGPTILPGWTNVYEGPRLLSDDGKRLFFESFDRLSDADENVTRDVYEFEFAGTGSCNSEDPAFDPASGGCHYLISSGRSEDESYLVDASSDSRDAFFSTRSSLVGWDTDGHFDIYDAREGGGFPEPEEEPSCEGEGCKPPLTAAPADASASTPRFQSSGNVAEAKQPRCPKGKRAVRGRSGKPRCVKPRKGKHAHKGGRGR